MKKGYVLQCVKDGVKAYELKPADSIKFSDGTELSQLVKTIKILEKENSELKKEFSDFKNKFDKLIDTLNRR